MFKYNRFDLMVNCKLDLLLTKNKFMKKNLSLKLMLLWMASIMFALNLSAQTVSINTIH